MVVPAPLYHNGPIVWSCTAWLAGSHVVVLPRFDAEATLAAIDRHEADTVYLVPTMMKRISRLPEEVKNAYDMSSLRAVWHLAEPCPEWLKQLWIDWLGPERIFELYAGTEAQTATVITGTEWLGHRGSVGRPVGGAIMICDPAGNELPVRHTRVRSGCDHPARVRRIATWARPHGHAKVDGSHWETSGGWTKTATCIWAIVCRT